MVMANTIGLPPRRSPTAMPAKSPSIPKPLPHANPPGHPSEQVSLPKPKPPAQPQAPQSIQSGQEPLKLPPLPVMLQPASESAKPQNQKPKRGLETDTKHAPGPRFSSLPSPLLQALLAAEAGLTDRAIQLASEAVEADPSNPLAQLILWYLYERRMLEATTPEDADKWRNLASSALESALSMVEQKAHPHEAPIAKEQKEPSEPREPPPPN
ncbi:MAG: hypothetical protein ACP5R4_05675 [Armatimonadota bacterium]